METRERWAKRIKEQERSGLSATEFCKRGGFSHTSFSVWKRQLKESQGGKFLSLDSASHEPQLEVELKSGIKLRVPREYELVKLKELLEALGC